MTTNESFSNLHEQPQWIPGLQLSASIFYTFIVLIGITGNILVLVIVLRYRDMRNATNYLLANLSVADLAVLIFCSPDGYQHLYGKDKHRLGDFMCRFSPFLQNATATCSALTIMAISYERHVAICQPLKTSTVQLNLFRTLPTVIFFWLVSCLVSVPFAIYTKTRWMHATYNETILTCFTQFPRIWSNVYLAPCTVFIYLIILAMLCYWNYSICYVLFNREALLRDNTIVTRYRRQVAKLLIAIIISFFILIFPYKIWGVIQSQLTLDQFHQIGFRVHSLILVIGRCLLYLNSAINPILYSIMSTKFRQSFVRLCNGFREPSKVQRSSAVLFYKEYAMRSGAQPAEKVGVRSSKTAASFQLEILTPNSENLLLLDENQTTTLNHKSIIFCP